MLYYDTVKKKIVYLEYGHEFVHAVKHGHGYAQSLHQHLPLLYHVRVFEQRLVVVVEGGEGKG